ncbi:MAG: hypothetical protein M0C28_43710 [Candidatus Moduliflexus flocculans]|nr:hypothetical protein [Candidatus Moduliflexus flocculans]
MERMRPFLSPSSKTYGQDLDIIWGNAIGSVGKMFLQPTFLVSNLPFNISTELFYGLCEGLPFNDLIMTLISLGGIVMVQEEFGRRLLNGTREARITENLAYSSSQRWMRTHFPGLKGGISIPVPNVDALVISFGPKRNGVRIPKDETMFKKVLLASFSSRRKKLGNSLHPGDLGIRSDMKAIRGLLRKDWTSDHLRPEELQR